MSNIKCEKCQGRGIISNVVGFFVNCYYCETNNGNFCGFYNCFYHKNGEKGRKMLKYGTCECKNCDGKGFIKPVTRFELMDI